MDFSKISFSSLLGELNVKEVYSQIKSMIEDVSAQLDLDKVQNLKEEDQVEFRKLRTEYIGVMDKARDFCDTAAPSIQYAMNMLQKDSTIDFATLLEMSESINPSEVLQICEKLYQDIGRLHDKISTDKDYQTNPLVQTFGPAFMGAAFCIGTVALVVCMPWTIPVEAAIVTGGAVAAAGGISTAILSLKGLSAGKLQKDVKELSDKLSEADKNILELKIKLSNIKRDHGSVEIRLKKQDADSLLQFYQQIDENLANIREICLRPLNNL